MTTDPRRWRKVEAILDAVLDAPAAARPPLLARLCGDDPALRREVEALLTADATGDGWLDGSALEAASGFLAETGDTDLLWAGRMVGPFRLGREIGRGGMGLVYLAERADGRFTQAVAIKLMRREWGGDDAARRFTVERQILARLNHPHIARLLDGGETDEGQPWLAMEYVAGESITRWADARRLSVRGRVALFELVVDAVRYAHQALVIHRDLKPSNILVTSTGSPKLLDFGIAKLTEGDDLADVTRTGLRLLTPDYGAPEQVRGEPAGTAADVYALGAVLYELLSGARAHRFAQHTPIEIERVICEVDPPLASTAVPADPAVAAARGTTPGRLRRALRGDLDSIVATALRKEPDQRYQSAEALLDDLRHWREGRPIRARPPTLGYRFVKLVRRNRTSAVAALAILFALIGGVSATLWQAREARQEASRARAVTAYLEGIFRGVTPEEARGGDLTASELLARGMADFDATLAGQADLQIELLGVLGRIHQDLALHERADSLLSRAVGLADRHRGPRSLEYAARLSDLGAVRLDLGRYAEADSLLEQALAIRRDRLGDAHPDLAITLQALAAVRHGLDRDSLAELAYREALAIDTRHFGPAHLQVATDLNNLGAFYATRSEWERGDSVLRAALTIRQSQLDTLHPLLLVTMYNLATVLRGKGELDEAEALQREVIRRRRILHPEGHLEQSWPLHALGRILENRGDFDAASATVGEALVLRRRFLGDTHPTTLITLNNLAILRYRLDDHAGAERLTREVWTRWREIHGPSHANTISAQNNLGAILLELGRAAEAEAILREVLAIRRGTSSPRGEAVSQTLRNLGRAVQRQGRLDEAEHLLRESEAIAREAYAERHPRHAEVLTTLGELLLARGRWVEADSLLALALAIREQRLGPDSPLTEETRRALSRARRGRH